MSAPKLIISPNPGLIAAAARDKGLLDRAEFVESELVEEGTVIVIDQEALLAAGLSGQEKPE